LLIRVVLCTHNGAKFIKEQLASIFTQHVPVDVVHVYDFASTDETSDIVASLARKWSQISLKLVDHAPGPSLSFFYALADIAPQCGSDDQIFLCDQDDIWLPEKTVVMLEAMAAAASRGEERLLLFHDVTICNEQLRPIRSSHYIGRPFRIPRDLAPERLYLANPIIGHTMLLSWPLVRLALNTLSPRQYLMHDWAFALLAAQLGQIVPVSAQLSLYRQHTNNVLGAGRSRSLLAYMRKALALARGVPVQALAFHKDISALGTLQNANPAPFGHIGEQRISCAIAKSMLRLGPTFGHRLIAVLIFFRVLALRRKKSENVNK
jgi:glycosyltransferase involved in cell wall biosynthesis